MFDFGFFEVTIVVLIAVCFVVHEMLGQFIRKASDPRKQEVATQELIVATLSMRMSIFGALFVFIMALMPFILGDVFGIGLYKVVYPATLAFFVASFKIGFDAGKIAFFSKIDQGLLPAFIYAQKYIVLPVVVSILPLSAYWISF